MIMNHMLRSYVWGLGIDNLLSITVYGETNQTYYALKNHQNSVLALANEDGNIAESYEYNAWGRVMFFDQNGNKINNQQSTIGNRYLFQGREYDSETGLYNFRARWYMPEIGRWISKDPIGISGGLNLYIFCENNPISFIDPLGLDYIDAIFNVFTGAFEMIASGVSSGIGAGAELVGDLIGWESLAELGKDIKEASDDFWTEGKNTFVSGVHELATYPEPESRWTNGLPWAPDKEEK